jgi:hypothetical protein
MQTRAACPGRPPGPGERGSSQPMHAAIGTAAARRCDLSSCLPPKPSYPSLSQAACMLEQLQQAGLDAMWLSGSPHVCAAYVQQGLPSM